MSITIDKDRALELLNEAVNERGVDYVYSEQYDHDGRCYYVEKDEQGNNVVGCLVGAALNKAGITIDQLIEFGDGGEVYGQSETAPDVCHVLQNEGIAEIDLSARTLFGLAQTVQDHGDSWGDALQEAVDHAAYLR